MKKILLIGRTGSGKTTLVQAFNKLQQTYNKTQAIVYSGNFVDTPGEFIENRRLYSALLVSSFDCDAIGFVQDPTDSGSIFPYNFASAFTKPVVGIITKADHQNRNLELAQRHLKCAGVERIIVLSSVDGFGLDKLEDYLEEKDTNITVGV